MRPGTRPTLWPQRCWRAGPCKLLEVWRLKAREADRRHVEDSIRQGWCDVDCSTERKGSPHVLVCTKNQTSYECRVAQRRADLDDLTRLKA
jgi:hypothetical protein